MDSFLLLRRLVAAIVFKGQTVSDYWWSRRTIFLTRPLDQATNSQWSTASPYPCLPRPLRWHRIENKFPLVWRVWKEASQIFDQHEKSLIC